MIIFVRHGEPDYSLRDTGIYQGFGVNFAGLTENGIRQIEHTAGETCLKGCSRILSSPYTRAIQTAAILSRALDLPITVEPDLHEWVANRAYVYETDAAANAAYKAYRENHGEYPDGQICTWEDAGTMRERVARVLLKYGPQENLILACHGMLIESVTGIHPEFGGIVCMERAEILKRCPAASQTN